MVTSVNLLAVKTETKGDNLIGYGMPWRSDAPCFSFIFPQKTIDINSSVWKRELLKIKEDIRVITISSDLEEDDYIILGELENLEQIYMYTAKKLKEIDFIERLSKLSILHIDSSEISDISPIERRDRANIEMYKKKREQNEKFHLANLSHISIVNSKIENITPLYEMSIVELILKNNRIKDASPIAYRGGIDKPYLIDLRGNPVENIEEVRAAHLYF